MAKKKKSKSASPSQAHSKSKRSQTRKIMADAPSPETDVTEDQMAFMADEEGQTTDFKESLETQSPEQNQEDGFHETLEASSEETEEEKRIRLEFYGSDILREKAPHAFELAEAVAKDWVNDGNFQKLPINSPLGQLVAAIGLQSAKRIEKKLEEKGVMTMAKMGLEIAKTKWPFKESKNESI